MAVTAYWYAKAMLSAFNKEFDFLTDTEKTALFTNSYTPNQDTHDYLNDADANEASGTGYTAGGATLGTKVNTNTTNTVYWGAANAQWTISGTLTARRAITYQSTGTNTNSPLMCWMDFGQDETASGGGTFTIAWASGNIANCVVTDAAGFP